MVALLALLARVAMVVDAHPPADGDAVEYTELTASLVVRGQYGRVGNSGWDDGLTMRAYRPPGYPLVRAALLIVFGSGSSAPLWLNVVCEMIALAFVAAAARRALDPWTGLLATALFAPMVLYTTQLMTESLSLALWSVLTWASVSQLRARAPWRALGIGVVAGCAILVRPISVLWVPVLAARLLGRERDVRTLSALLAPAMVIVGAWSLRNYAIFDTWVWATTNLGVHNARDFFIPWQRFAELRRGGLDEPQADRALLGEILQFVARDPVYACELFGRRLVDLFSVSTATCPELEATRAQTLRTTPLGAGLLDASIALVRAQHVLSIAGAAWALGQRRVRQHRLVAPLALFLFLQCMLSRGDVRFVAPVMPVLCILAALAARRTVGRALAAV